MKKKVVLGCIAAMVVIIIFALTFQNTEGTIKLSDYTRKMLEAIGWKVDGQKLRSNVHIVMYFALGVAIVLFGRSVGWKPWMTLLIGCAIGLLDETVKVFLPSREFDLIDLLKDFLGVGLANLIWLERRGPDTPGE